MIRFQDNMHFNGRTTHHQPTHTLEDAIERDKNLPIRIDYDGSVVVNSTFDRQPTTCCIPL